MFDYIIGTLTKASLHKITLETHGVGYLLYIPVNDYAALPPLGKTLTCYITTVIREDSHKSYGFLAQEQRDLFETLIEISGIGPKTALALIGHMDLSTLEQAISQGKPDLICKIPGVGKKTSERLIIEMRDKIKHLSPDTKRQISPTDGVESDAISALVNLGYHLTAAQKAIKTVAKEGKTQTLPELITAALRQI